LSDSRLKVSLLQFDLMAVMITFLDEIKMQKLPQKIKIKEFQNMRKFKIDCQNFSFILL
jgi:hypothetical protein